MKDIPQSGKFIHELTFTTSRSGGPGGQNVNKVNTKVTLKWNVVHSQVLTDDQKEMLLRKAKSWITKHGELVLTSQEKRSQFENKQNVLQKLDLLLSKAFTPKKVRKKTQPTKTSAAKRAGDKRHRSEKKQWRRKVE